VSCAADLSCGWILEILIMHMDHGETEERRTERARTALLLNMPLRGWRVAHVLLAGIWLLCIDLRCGLAANTHQHGGRVWRHEGPELFSELIGHTACRIAALPDLGLWQPSVLCERPELTSTCGCVSALEPRSGQVRSD
jgi:hypothetical protein